MNNEKPSPQIEETKEEEVLTQAAWRQIVAKLNEASRAPISEDDVVNSSREISTLTSEVRKTILD